MSRIDEPPCGAISAAAAAPFAVVSPPVYDSDRHPFSLLAEARALWDYRHLVRELVARDIKVRYKRSVLGIAWTMLSPLLTMVALTFAFSALLKEQIQNFPVYLLSGTLFWTFFSQSSGYAAALAQDALDITRRVYVPRSVFVASAVGGALVNLVLSVVPLLLIILATGFPIHATWLFLPVPVLFGILFTGGVSLIVFTLSCRFVDVRETYLVLLSPWFFVTPIIYTPASLAEKYRPLVQLNPMTHLVEIFRRPIYDGRLPEPGLVLLGAVVSVGALALGWLFYAAKNDEYGTRG